MLFHTCGHSKCFTIISSHSPIHTVTARSAIQGESQLVWSTEGQRHGTSGPFDPRPWIEPATGSRLGPLVHNHCLLIA